MKIAVLGTGVVGLTLAARLVELGHTVTLGTRDPAATRARTAPEGYATVSVADVLAANPQLGHLRADVEALLVRGPDREHPGFSAHVVPIDACYELVGTMRATWRGFDGGKEAGTARAAFFDAVEHRSRPAP